MVSGNKFQENKTINHESFKFGNQLGSYTKTAILLIIDAFSFQVEEKWSSQLIICNLSHSIFSYVEIQKHLLENYDGQSFNVIQVLNITCSPSLK